MQSFPCFLLPLLPLHRALGHSILRPRLLSFHPAILSGVFQHRVVLPTRPWHRCHHHYYHHHRVPHCLRYLWLQKETIALHCIHHFAPEVTQTIPLILMTLVTPVNLATNFATVAIAAVCTFDES